MSSFTYTGTLTDIGLGVIASSNPVMRVRPEVEAFGPDGVVSAKPRPVSVKSSTGAFSMTLYPSGQLTPGNGGPTGVAYILEVGRFEDTIDGKVFHGIDVWRFIAATGGGNIGDMAGGSLLAVWIGPPWPSPLQKGLYLDTNSPNPWGVLA